MSRIEGDLMIGNKRVFALIMIREGSKRISDKAMRLFNGVPLCRHTVYKCLRSKYIDDVFISTSSQKYKEIVTGWGCKVIDRPIELSEDSIPNLPVFKHAAQIIPADPDDYIIWVDFSKPLTKISTINKVIDLAHKYGYDSVFTVKKLRGKLIGDTATVSQVEHKDEVRHLYFGAARLFTKKTLDNAELGTWGTGEKHFDAPIIKDYETDVDYDYDFVIAEALVKAGY